MELEKENDKSVLVSTIAQEPTALDAYSHKYNRSASSTSSSGDMPMMDPKTPEESSQLPTPLPSGSVYKGVEQPVVLDATASTDQPNSNDGNNDNDSGSSEKPKLGLGLIGSSIPSDTPSSPTREVIAARPEKERRNSTVEVISAEQNQQINKLCEISTKDIQQMTDSTRRRTLVSAVEVLKEMRESANKYKSLLSHFQLQNRLLTIETHEAAQRYEVENNLIKRQVERLKSLDRHDDEPTSNNNLHPAEVYRRRLQKAKLKLQDAHMELEEKNEEIERLKKRLREGRLHREAIEAAAAASHHRNNQQHHHHHHHHHPHHHQQQQQQSPNRHSPRTENNGLAALGLLASQVLSQQQEQQQSPYLFQPSPQIQSNRMVSQTANLKNMHSPPSAGLMSPVDFMEPTLALTQQTANVEKRRRESSASTISIPSEIEDNKDKDDPNATQEEDNDEQEARESESQDIQSSPKRDSPIKRSPPSSPKKYIRRDSSNGSVGGNEPRPVESKVLKF